KSSLGPNWVGFTNNETVTKSQRAFAARTRDKCPSWIAPMVGTRPRHLPVARSARAQARISEIVVMTFIDQTKTQGYIQRRDLREHTIPSKFSGTVNVRYFYRRIARLRARTVSRAACVSRGR